MSWILDLIFFLVLVGGLALGVRRGFLSGVCRLAGTLFAVVFAFFYCVSFEGFLENVFHMTSAISDGFVGVFSKNPALAAEISGSGEQVATALRGAGVPDFFANIIAGIFAQQAVPEGTSAAMLIAPVISKWIAIAISFLLLIIIIKLGTFLADKILSGLVDKVMPLRIVNRALGGLLGLFKGLIILFVLLAICSWIPAEPMHEFISSAGIVGKIFTSEWFQAATSYIVSFQWLNDYLMVV